MNKSTNYFFSSLGAASVEVVGVSGRTRAPTSANIFFNSPLLYKSVTISQPPTNSPPINNWGKVGQSLHNNEQRKNLTNILSNSLEQKDL